MSQKVNLNAYFERIGFAGSIAPTLATLEAIHALHPAAIPFETIDPVMGRPVLLDQPSLEQKLLHKGRGGFGFEHNTLLMNVLRDLDFTVRSHAALMLLPHGESAALASHLVLVVDIAGTSYLCDVGSSTFMLTAPIKLRDGLEQQVGRELFRPIRQAEGWLLEVKVGDDWHGVYQFDLAEQGDSDIAALSHAAEKHYFDHALLLAARIDKDGRSVLSGTRLSIHRPGEAPELRHAADVDALKAMLNEVFRITLPLAVDLLDPALQRVIAADDAPSEA